MKTSYKILIGIIILAVIVLIYTLFGNTTENVVKENKPVVKIGASLPLTGGAGFIGQGMKDAIELAKENQKDTKYDYQIVYEDDKLDAKEASNAVQKLINIDSVDVLISATSGPGNVIAPIAEQNKVLHMSTASDGNIAKKQYNFIHWTTPEEEARTFVAELQRRNIKKVAVIGTNQQGIIAVTDAVKENIKGTDINIVSESYFNFGDKDFKTLLIKAKESNPDIYLFESFSPEIEAITKQARELGITNITSIESFEMSEEPELFEGLWYVNPADSTEEFNNLYNAKYGKNPGLAAANGYDEFNLIVMAYENAGKNLGPDEKPSVDQVSDELLKIKNYKGALGNLNVLSNRIVDSKAVVRMIKDGKPVTIHGGSQ